MTPSEPLETVYVALVGDAPVLSRAYRERIAAQTFADYVKKKWPESAVVVRSLSVHDVGDVQP